MFIGNRFVYLIRSMKCTSVFPSFRYKPSPLLKENVGLDIYSVDNFITPMHFQVPQKSTQQDWTAF